MGRETLSGAVQRVWKPRPPLPVRPTTSVKGAFRTLFPFSRPFTSLGGDSVQWGLAFACAVGEGEAEGLVAQHLTHTHTHTRPLRPSFFPCPPNNNCCFGEMRAIRAGTAQGGGGREGGAADEAFEAYFRFVKKNY